MSMFENFFNKFFGRRNNHEPPNNGYEDHGQYDDGFRHPIWQTDDDDDDDAGDFGRQSRSGMHFNIFTNPFEMTRYFESQMENMRKDFLNTFGREFGVAVGPFANNSILALPHAKPSDDDLRNQVLKPGYEYPSANGNPKLDMDLDGKINVGDLPREWKGCGDVVPDESTSRKPLFSFKSFGKSISRQVTRQSDGTMEQRVTITDSNGNSETTVTRQIGDETHTIKITRDKNGVETKTEDLVNIDQNQLLEFDKKWQPLPEPFIEPGTLNPFPWNKYFSFNPKL